MRRGLTSIQQLIGLVPQSHIQEVDLRQPFGFTLLEFNDRVRENRNLGLRLHLCQADGTVAVEVVLEDEEEAAALPRYAFERWQHQMLTEEPKRL
jgi:hypothetical protein